MRQQLSHLFLRRWRRPPPSIDEALWRSTCQACPWLHALDAGRQERLRGLAAHFLHRKAITPVAGLTLLIVFASRRGDAWHVVSFTVFGLTLLALYTASAFAEMERQSQFGIGLYDGILLALAYSAIAAAVALSSAGNTSARPSSTTKSLPRPCILRKAIITPRI